jgi:hypothetical protein
MRTLVAVRGGCGPARWSRFRLCRRTPVVYSTHKGKHRVDAGSVSDLANQPRRRRTIVLSVHECTSARMFRKLLGLARVV